MKKLIIFDLDGTLVDTSEDLSDAFNFALNSYGYKSKTVEEIKGILGNGVSNSLAMLIPNGKENIHYFDMLNKFNEYYEQHYLDKTHPFLGIIDTVNLLKEMGFKLAVCTNKKHEFACEIIHKFFGNYFDLIQGKIDALPLKPNPDMNNYIQNRLNIKCEESIYIGDTEVDLLTATNSKIDCLLVSYGFRKKIDLEKLENKKGIIDSPIQIIDWIKKQA